ncbi:MAG: saccharopine dehydrogenase family protein [Flavobacteriales bacterium]|jgi:saccharopine dehydrogenase (NAD+, L-lysine forming)|nr:saccharopine dehydrogenase family protein [Flavobacteriales bacterium]
MEKVLIIGAGGVSNVATKKIARLTEIFKEITLASRTKSKCDAIAAEIDNCVINTARVDADNVNEVVELINRVNADLVVNLALPYQDLPIMDACLITKTHYLDTANYEPKDVAKFEYSWQWAYKKKFEDAGIMALLGCGFDPGVTQVFTAYAAKHYFDEIHYLDIVDCNGGDHGKAFATNFNPEVNIREITQQGKYWENGKWVETKPMEIHKPVLYPNIGEKESYLMYHEELESLVINFPTIKRARFWMTFGKEYLTHLRVLENVGMTSIKPINYDGKMIQPLQFLKAVLPEPSSLGENYSGETSIGCQITGIKNGQNRTYYIYNNCSHQSAYNDVKGQGVSYTTGVPAMIGAKMMATGEWFKPGVFNVEEFNPDPFMDDLNEFGLMWQEVIDKELPINK